MAETAKAHERRIRERFFERYLIGEGVDVGCNDDPVTPTCCQWEKGDGPLTGMWDWIYSSHCLEHIDDAVGTLKHWWSCLKPGGRLIVSVPHRDLYERKINLPSIWNGDHRTFWVPFYPHHTDPPHTRGLVQCGVLAFGEYPIRLTVEDTGWFYVPPEIHASGELSIEGIWRKA